MLKQSNYKGKRMAIENKKTEDIEIICLNCNKRKHFENAVYCSNCGVKLNFRK